MPRLKNAKSYKSVDRATLLAKVREIVQDEEAVSVMFDASSLHQFPQYDRDEIDVGRVVGRGGFAVVRDIQSINLHVSKSNSNSEQPRKGGGGRLSRNTTNTTTTASTAVATAKEDGGDDDGAAEVAESATTTTTPTPTATAKPPPKKGPKKGPKTNTGDEEFLTREMLARRVWNKKAGRYVLKEVEPLLEETDKVTYLKGMIDLALEARLLAALHHPHVLSLRAAPAHDPWRPDQSYFIILDKLEETLSKRLTSWMLQRRASTGITGALTGGKKKFQRLLADRVLVMYDVASALNYLHSKRIIYRDLKPDNIGFTYEHSLKLFDFGLAKELRDSERVDEDGLYRMTPLTGAVRYMAPEVGLKQPYGLSADVYSFSMLTWYIMALEPPFGLYTPKMFLERVFGKVTRPAILDGWPDELGSLMKQCWEDDSFARPTCATIMQLLRDYVLQLDPKIAAFMVPAVNEEE